MRRSDREVADFREILDILRRADTIHLGLRGEEYPYVVPLSFGFEVADGKIVIYFHGAQEGLKHELLAANSAVCVEASLFHGYREVPGSVTAEYEAVIGFGQAGRVTGSEAARGLDLLLEHCGYAGFAYDLAALEMTAVYKITLTRWSGKRQFVRK
ncbi:MAG: pyridoxamine 5'-phosphate oxidase family protein [Oscillospiraceae bacterium]|jgi:nitroimidazol reductase NimA-like FMN-containing flavoprotein (pyridoxamine 5'-phosphate oxidase superfamily)|nr:pyridoxamine 5'-phosphate oxidase family protein [Oscillospiraceae bacterium]